jgi:regulator of protease activity HflC (stomatin/prohibitin superfamily)
VRQLDVNCETKTKDNVFVNVVISVQYQVVLEKAFDAFYKLANPEIQIQAYVFDVVRSELPKMELDESFSNKEQLANEVKHHLDETMMSFGYSIIKALVTDISPDARVKMSMNEINASRRLREAAKEKAEADKIVQVKAAEADAESKYLSGVGVARQRQAIVGGLQDSIIEFSGEIAGTTPKDVMDLLLLTQYFDMLKDVGSSGSGGKTLFLPHAPSAVGDLQDSLKNGLMGSLNK